MSEYLDARKRQRGTIDGWADGFEVIAARSTTEAEPAYIIPTGPCTTIATHIAYVGTVATGDIRIWRRINGVWYRGATVADALTFANETREWVVQPGTEVGFTISTISGGGTMAVIAEGIVEETD